MTAEILTVGLPTLAVLIGILVNNTHLTDLRQHMDRRFDELAVHVDALFENSERKAREHLARIQSRLGAS